MKCASVLLAASWLFSGVSAQSPGTGAGIDVWNRVLFGNPAGSGTYYAGAELPWAAPPQRPRALVYALEAGGALGGVAVCGGVAALSSIDFSQVLLTASIVGLPFATGCAVSLAGGALGERGKFGGAIIGAWAGAPLTIGVLYVSMTTELYSSLPGLVATAVLAVAPIPIGAVVGYNLSIPRTSTGTIGRRLRPPGVTFTSRELPDRSVEYGVRVRLAGLTF